jgi:sugar (pentulose or hexulose) kinase
MALLQDELTLVIDIGKSHAKLLMVDGQGSVVERHGRKNASVVSALGYPALDVYGLQEWMAQTLRASDNTARCSHAIASTHGAAMVALDETGLAWEPLDYEWDGLAPYPLLAQAFNAAADGFSSTLSPDLPAGLNAARQLFYVQNLHADAWRRTRYLVPYAQYWAWLLCGERASEVSSLGCHTHLWQPQTGGFSTLAQARGWADLFAPLRSAWEVLGPVCPDIVRQWGLPLHCQVHVGVHDSNACLARYLTRQTSESPDPAALTVVSSGTWTVLMAPGAPTATLQAERDMLANVDVLGRATPTARFMGGREFAALLDGAPADAGTLDDVRRLIETGTMALPSFAPEGGPFKDRVGMLLRGADYLSCKPSDSLSSAERSALAAVYCAQVTALLVAHLWKGVSAISPSLVVEGPLASNSLYLSVLQALLPRHALAFSSDALEGTARGAWLLCHWAGGQSHPDFLRPAPVCALQGLMDYHLRWVAALG